jgi:hypothetical protein
MKDKKGRDELHLIPSLLALLFLVGIFSLIGPSNAHAAGGSIIISGSGLNNPNPITVTQDMLRGTEPLPAELQTVAGTVYLQQQDIIYSTINTWPTKSWYRGQGVKLTDLLALAGGLNENATLIKFTSGDGFSATFTVQELIQTPRYLFPNFMNTGLPGHLIGDASDAVEVPAIIAHHSCSVQDWADVQDADNLSTGDANLLLYGQRAVTQQTNARFAKYVKAIEVLTDPIPQWGIPTASVAPGEVPVGTLVELHSPFDDEDKVHYTLDGSPPTIESPIYNWIASRWWSSRENELKEINRPIEITDNTIIKAFVAGPGRLDSDVVTFEYTVPLTICKDNPAHGTPNQEYIGHTFTAVGGTKPYQFDITGNLPEGLRLNGASLEGTPVVSGTFAFTITVTDNTGKKDSHEFSLLVGYAPPLLTADATDNTVGQTIELTFTDDAIWRQAITDIEVNGIPIKGKFEISNGVITIASDVFTAAGDYNITIIAAGYLPAVVTQKVIAGSGEQKPEQGEIVLRITGDGVITPKEFTQSQLEAMPQHQEVYSAINTWPSKKWYVGKGVRLRDLLNSAGMKGNAQQIKFRSRDGYYTTLTVQELLRDTRYRFPNFKSGGGDGDGHIPGSPDGAIVVEPIIALVSAEGTDNPAYMNDTNALLLMLGQRAVTEQTGPLFAKYIDEIEVLTSPPGKWDEPTAEPEPGNVRSGTKVTLHSPYDDHDKVYYTTDGSTPTLNSPMFNWVAKRWWAARGDETVKAINKPIEINQDTTIKAVTIGPGKLNSNIVEFTYKVVAPPMQVSDQINPSQGGQVSLGDQVVLDIPAGALEGTDPVEIKIERVSEPPAAPTGFRIIGHTYEFKVGDLINYQFNEPVTIKFKFNPEEIGPEQIPAVFYYDEEQQQWVNLGGQVSGDTITVQVHHFTKFAVMVTEKSMVTATINPAKGGEVSLAEEATLKIPAGALAGTKPVEVKIERMSETPAVPAGFKFIAATYEFSVDGKTDYRFKKPVTIILAFDSADLESEQDAAVYYYDLSGKKWVKLGGEVSGSTIAVEVNYLGQFTVMATGAMAVNLSDIAGHWAEDNIRQLVNRGAVSGYPDGTFKPDNNITRAEFVAILVKAFQLEPNGNKIFADTKGHWAQKVISTAAHYGIVSGYGDNRFGPDDYITREQMAVMIVKAAKITPAIAELSFADSNSISAWAQESLATAVKNGIINGYLDNTVRPQNNATRAEAVTVIINALD